MAKVKTRVKDQEQPQAEMHLEKAFCYIMDAFSTGKRRIFLDGGTTSSKTYSAMQFGTILLPKTPESWIMTVISESIPHLKRGTIRDFQNIMGSQFVRDRWNNADRFYTWDNGSILEFMPGDDYRKFQGGRRHIAFFNELNNIHRDVYREADLRTFRFTIGDWNPYHEFWFHDEEIAKQPGNVHITGMTYKDAPSTVTQSLIQTIESYKDTDPNYYRVHALGLLGKIEGIVHPNFEQVDSLPECDFYFWGLDYGFLGDPTVAVKNCILGDKLFSKEMVFKYGELTNDEIYRELVLAGIGRDPLYPDPDEPKSNKELQKMGLNVQETVKGRGSVAYGIQRVNQFYQHWTRDSLNSIKAQRNYRYLEDRNEPGRFTEKTTHQWSHPMDARRYAVASVKPGEISAGSGSYPKAVDYLTGSKDEFSILKYLREVERANSG